MRILLLALAVAVACESDESKAERLRNDMVLSCAAAQGNSQYQNDCDVATRKYNRFMAGR